MITAVLVACALGFTLLAAGAWIGLVEYVITAVFGHRAIGTVTRLEQCPVYVRRQIAIIQFETEAGPIEVKSDGIWTGPAFLRIGSNYPVCFLRDATRAIIMDLSEFFQRIVGVVLTTPLALGFIVWVWFREWM